MIDINFGPVKFRAVKDERDILLWGNLEKIESKECKDGRILVRYPYNEYMIGEVKAMEGSKWMGFASDENPRPIKAWSVLNTVRNRFQLAYLMGQNPYEPYDGKLPDFFPRRKKLDGTVWPYGHQLEIASHILHRKGSVVAGEPGVGKTLAAMEAMEASGITKGRFLWVGPKSALDAVRYEFRQWAICEVCGKLGKHHRYENHPMIDNRLIIPRWETYDGLKKLVTNWNGQFETFQFIVYDEAQKIKTPTAQRTQAAQHIADSARDMYGKEAVVTCMTGSPAPKSPADWWSICNVAMPGFLREGDLKKFQRRLCLIEMQESLGASYPKLVTWWDDPKKCGKCGKSQEEPEHAQINMCEKWFHPYRVSVNEVAKLADRLRGLVIVKLKKDCLDLPEIVYKRMICKPAANTLRAANLLTKNSISTIRALTLLRELSDGFQYREVEQGTEKCPECKGRLIIKMQVDLDDPHNPLDSESLTRGHRAVFDEDSQILIGFKQEPLRIGTQDMKCYVCHGKGEVPLFLREAAVVPSPKDDAVIDLLDTYEDEGRTVFWAGFTESVDRVSQLLVKNEWPIVRLDGRGWWSSDRALVHSRGDVILEAFDDKKRFPKLGFVGQPGAGGTGINLTASSMCCYFSNTFKFEDRDQSVQRIHRPGADHNRGCTVYDLIHLPQDLWVLNNLIKKMDLQAMSMGQIIEGVKKFEEDFVRET